MRPQVSRVFLRLGEEYTIVHPQKRWVSRKLKFIQVTPKGFNFLDMKTNKCVFKRHLYISRKIDAWDDELNGCWFFIRVPATILLSQNKTE